MGSLVGELQRLEAAARAGAEELRGRIAELAERLAQVEKRLSQLVIAREVVGEVLDGTADHGTGQQSREGSCWQSGGPRAAWKGCRWSNPCSAKHWHRSASTCLS
jgi:hypothetical protein